jgi:hypothetical protein
MILMHEVRDNESGIRPIVVEQHQELKRFIITRAGGSLRTTNVLSIQSV